LKGINYQNKPCKRCGEVIEDYSLSGLCRSCWNINRKRKHYDILASLKFQCDICGRPMERAGLCFCCKRKHDEGYLTRYRVFLNRAEHRFVYEHFKGIIPKGHIIHHLNGLKGDNRIGNLVAMPRADHDSKSIVNELKRRIRELEITIQQGKLNGKR